MSWSSEVLGRSPLAWWKQDESSGTTLADASGNGRSVTLNADLSAYGQPAAGAGLGGTSTTWNGTQCGQHAGSFLDGLTEFTVVAWVKFTANGYVLNRDNLAGGTQRSFQFYVSSGKASLVAFGTGSGIATATSSNTLNDNAWHMIAGKFKPAASGSDTFVYVDGVLRGTSTLGGPWRSTVTFNLSLGAGLVNTTLNAPFSGGMDDVVLFGSALSDADIAALYTAGTTPPAATGPVAATLPSLTASASGTVALPTTSGPVAVTLPSLTASAAGTFVSNDVSGTVTATLPPLSTSVAGDVDEPPVTGTVAATLPALTAHVGDIPGDTAGPVAATLPALSGAIVGTVPLVVGSPWLADLSQRTLLPLVTSGRADAIPPLEAAPPAIVEHPIMRRSRTVPDPTTIAGARIDEGTGRITIPDPVYDAFPVTESVLGVPHLFVDRRDVTYFRGSRTQVRQDRAQEPFGDAQLVVDFPQISTLDDEDAADLAWLRVDATVHYVLQHWDADGPTGVLSTLFHGRLVSDDSGNDSTSPQQTWTARGDLWQAASFVHQPRVMVNPVDIGTQIPKVLNGITSRRYPKIANVATGIRTLQRGNAGEKVMEYAQGLLADAYTDDGRQWTVAKKPGTVNAYQLRLKKTGSQWTVTNGQRGLEVSLSSDSTQSRNVIWGRGQRSDGGVWMHKLFPDAARNAPAYPYSSAGTVMTVGSTDAGTSTGDGVSTWQRRARALGFTVTVDGVYNSADAAACRRLQAQYGILVDGIVGPQTWAETFDVGARGADPDSWVRLPLAWLPGTMPLRYRANGSVIGPDPAYDPSIAIVSDDLDMGTDITLAEGIRSAQQIIARENPPSLSGTLTLRADPREGSRLQIEAGDRITLIGYKGRNVVLHVADRSRDWQYGGAVTLQVAERAVDALTLAQIRQRDNANRADVGRRPGKARTKPTIDPWDCESNAGHIERHALYPGLWTVIRIPMSEYGRISSIDLHTTPAARYCIFLFANPITSAQMIRYVGAAPLGLDSPGETNRELLEDQFGWLQGWGRKDDAAGYYPGSQGSSSPLTGRFKDAGVDYWSPTGYIYIAEWADRPTFIEGELRAAPPEM